MLGGDRAAADIAIFRKTKMCKFFLKGQCTKSGSCAFAHGDTDMHPLPDFSRTKMCPDLADTGRCDRGAACRFAHSIKELRTSKHKSGRAVEGVQRMPRVSGMAMGGGRPMVAPGVAMGYYGVRSALVAESPMIAVAQGTVVIAHAVQARAVHAVMVPYAQVPVAQLRADASVTVALAERSASAKLSAAMDTPPPPDFAPTIDMEALEGALDASYKKACSPATEARTESWSRQSTEVGLAPLQEFSRQSTGEFSRQSIEEAPSGIEMLDETFRAAPGALEGIIGDERAGFAKPLPPELSPHFAASLGQGYDIKNTFVDYFREQVATTTLRRVRSTGELASYV